MLTICPTIDYEIYLGKNLLSPAEVLFKPTDELMKLWSDYNIKATIFPDIYSNWRHQELGLNDFCNDFETQIINAASAGYDIQLHIHPEWHNSKYINGLWTFEKNSSALHDMGFNLNSPNNAQNLIRKGKKYLNDLISQYNPSYECYIFRAGGWIIQPENELFRALIAENIRIDATVIPGFKSIRSDYKIDFTKIPNKTSWFVTPSLGVNSEAKQNTNFLELTIGSYRGKFPFWQHVLNELRLRKRSKILPEEKRGYPIIKSGPKPSAFQQMINKYIKLNIPRVFDISDTHESMLATLNSYFKYYDCEENDIAICMNGHPKDFYGHHQVELRRFFDIVFDRYADRIEFKTIHSYISEKHPYLLPNYNENDSER